MRTLNPEPGTLNPELGTLNPITLAGYKTVADLLAKSAFFVITVLAARLLTREAFGMFAVGATLGWIAALASDFGIQVHVAREVARAPHRSAVLMRRWLPVRLATSAAAAILSAAGTALLLPAEWFTAVVLLVLAYLAGGLLEFFYFFFRGLSRSDVESTLTILHRAGALACAGAALWARPDLTLLAAALLLSAVLALLCALAKARRIAPPAIVPDAARVAPSAEPTWTPDVRARVFHLGAGALLAGLYFRVDVFLLERWTAAETVALYNAVFRIVEAMRLLPAAVLAVALPLLFRSASARPLVQLSAGLTLFACAASGIVWIWAPALVPFVYGPEYAGAVPAFRVLLAAFPLMSLNYALTHQLIGWDGHRGYAALCGAALVFNIALNAELIPRLSLLGAAWTTLATEALLTAGCLTLLWLRAPRRRVAVPEGAAERVAAQGL